MHRITQRAPRSPLRYEMDGKEQYRAQTAIEDAGEDLGGDLPLAHAVGARIRPDRHQPRQVVAGPRAGSSSASRTPTRPRSRRSGSPTARSPRPSSRSSDGRWCVPSCGTPGADDEAVLPRVRDAADPRRRRWWASVTERQARARKVFPQYGEGRAGQGRVGAQPGRGRADRRDAARGGHPERRQAQRRLRRAGLPRRRAARHPRRRVGRRPAPATSSGRRATDEPARRRAPRARAGCARWRCCSSS